METEERDEFVRQMDEEFDKFLADKIANSEKNNIRKDPADFDREIEELKNHPAFIKDIDLSKPLHPLTEALIAMKYESDDLELTAESYKEDGNKNFEKKKYIWAIDNYAEGIKQKCANKLLNAQLYANRAAANWFLQNYRSCYKDCLIALKFKSDHMKAIIRAANCCEKLSLFADAIDWCDKGLDCVPDEKKLLELRPKIDKLLRQKERDNRQRKLNEKNKEKAELRLINTIIDKGVTLSGVNTSKNKKAFDDPLLVEMLESNSPSGNKVFCNPNGDLVWPVIFLYPEYTQSDLIAEFNEKDTLDVHLLHMFGPDTEPPPWDIDSKYVYERLEIYFEDVKKEKLHHLKKSTQLNEILKDDAYVVYGGTPTFILLIRDAEYTIAFLEKYK